MILSEKYNVILESNGEEKLLGYHITRRKNLNKIRKTGLIPKVPKDYGESGDEKAVYLFISLEEAKNALYNWLGERIEEWEEEHEQDYDEVCLVVDVTGLTQKQITEEGTYFYEMIVREKIDPSRILEILEI